MTAAVAAPPARATAHADSAPTVAAAPREVLAFRLGAEEYGLDILRVQEIRSFEAPTRIAGAPPHVIGVTNLRGVIVPLVDLRLRFGLAAAVDAATVTIVVSVADRTVGAVVDAVSDVVALPADRVRPAPAFSGAVDTAHLEGIATLGEGEQRRMLILVDIARLLAGCAPGLAA